MGFTYIILILTSLVFPILGLTISKFIQINKIPKFTKIIIAFYLSHNLFYYFGFSLKGDYVDYIIFSSEYLMFCMAVFLLIKKNNIYLKIFSILGLIIISIVFFVGLAGIYLFYFVGQDFETDKVFHFTNNDKPYETRRFSFGGATLSNTRFTFETYRIYNYLPFERKIDKTDFFDTETNLIINEDQLKIDIIKIGNSEQIKFQSTNGNNFTKKIN